MNDMTPEERRKKVKQLRDSGMTFAAIAKQMGFSTERARCLYQMALHYEEYQKDSVFKNRLPIRALNVLLRYGITTLDELKAVSPDYIMKMRNVGKQTFDMIMKVREME